MKQLFPPLTLSSTGKEMTVSGYQLPEPQSNTYPEGYRKGRENGYQSDYKKWQDSKVIVKVQEEDKEYFFKAAWQITKFSSTHFEDLLSVGIDISSLADRLEYYEEKRCTNSCDWPKCTFKDCMEKHPEKWTEGKEWFVRLLPAKQFKTAICPTCGIERKVNVDKDGSGCFLAAEQTETVKEEPKTTAIAFLDSIMEYVRESGTNIAHDERTSEEFWDIFIMK